jgi:hypothetical protein
MQRDTAGTRFTVGFEQAAVSLIDLIARERRVSDCDVVHAAVVAMLESRRSADTADRHRPDAVTTADFDPLADVATSAHAGRRPTRRVDVYIDGHATTRLADFCRSVKLSKARAIRMAVDRYLFDAMVTAGQDGPRTRHRTSTVR